MGARLRRGAVRLGVGKLPHGATAAAEAPGRRLGPGRLARRHAGRNKRATRADE